MKLRYIENANDFVSVAKLNGVFLTEEEADVMLGYLEGHDYSLMVEGKSTLMRHDNQNGNDYLRDEVYGVFDVVLFSLEMNDWLIRDYIDDPDENKMEMLKHNEDLLCNLMSQIESEERKIS